MLASATMIVAATSILVQSILRVPDNNLDSAAASGFIRTVLPPRLVIMVLLITGYLIAMPTLGFLVASGIFLFLSFGYLWRRSLVISLLLTLVSVASVYLVFRKLFQVVLPKGTLLQSWF